MWTSSHALIHLQACQHQQAAFCLEEALLREPGRIGLHLLYADTLYCIGGPVRALDPMSHLLRCVVATALLRKSTLPMRVMLAFEWTSKGTFSQCLISLPASSHSVHPPPLAATWQCTHSLTEASDSKLLVRCQANFELARQYHASALFRQCCVVALSG